MPVLTSFTARVYLPPELQLNVVSHLRKKDLKAMRLVSKEYEAAASPFLFDKAYLAARQGVLNTFIKLTSHPMFSKYVREFFYDSSWFDPDIAESFHNYAHLPLSRRSKKTCMNPLSRAGHNEYIKLFDDQSEIHDIEEIYHLLKAALRNTPNLKRIVFADMSRRAFLPGDEIENLESFAARIYSRTADEYRSDDIKWETRRNDLRREYGGFDMLMRALSEEDISSVQDFAIGKGQHSCDDRSLEGISQMMFYKSRLALNATKHVSATSASLS